MTVGTSLNSLEGHANTGYTEELPENAPDAETNPEENKSWSG